MTTIIYREQEGTGLGEYARVLMKGLTQIGYKFNPLPIVENSKFKRLRSYLAPNAHYTEPFSFVLGADLMTIHDLDFGNSSRKYRLSLEYSIKSAKHLVVSSNVVADEFANWYPPLRERITVAHWGVDTDLFNFSSDDIRTYDSMDHDKIRVLMVGQLIKRKNFLPVLKQLSNNDKFRITLVSDLRNMMDLDYSRMASEIIDNSSNTFLLSNLSYQELRQQYLLSDILIQPSLSGGFEMPIYEALAMGTEVLAYPLAVHKELLRDIISYSDFNSSLTEEIESIVDFKKKAHLHDFVESNYSPRTMAKEMIRAYNEAGVA
ncbi:MAG: glycosyltransferase [Candidatus Micrarchaeaceae archaeon]